MALSTQVFLLCLFSLVADSYFLVINEPLPHGFSLGILSPFERLFKEHSRKPFVSNEAAAVKNKPAGFLKTEKETPIIYPEEHYFSPVVGNGRNINSAEEKIDEADNYVNTVKGNRPLDVEVKTEIPFANTLSIHDEEVNTKPTPIFSIKVTEDEKKNESAEEDIEVFIKPTNVTEDVEKKLNETDKIDVNDDALEKKTDLLIIPVNAINLSPVNTAAVQSLPLVTPNTITPLVNVDNSQYANTQNIPISNGNNMLGNQGFPQPNLYTVVNVPNNSNYPGSNGANNMYYVMNPNQNNGYSQTNNGQFYKLVPVQNLPNNGMNFIPNYQGNGYIPVNNRPNGFIPITNGQNNFVPITNGPNNFVPVNAGPNYIVPNNNINVPNNFIPVNNGPNSFIPNNNIPMNNYQPSTYIPINNGQNNMPYNNPNNLVPTNNYQNNFVPVNNYPNNFVPTDNQFKNNGPNNYLPVNNGQNNYVPVNNGQNNFVPVNDGRSNFIPNNNGQNNYVPINTGPNHFLPSDNSQNTYVPVNNGLNNYNPDNNGPSNFNSNNNGRNNFNPNYNGPNNLNTNINVPDNFNANNNGPNNFNPNYSGPNNFTPFNDKPSNVVQNNAVPITSLQPVGILLNYKDEEEEKDEGIDV